MKSKFFLKTFVCMGTLALFLQQSCNEEDISANTLSNSYDKELKNIFTEYEVVKIDNDAIWKIAKDKPGSPVTVNLGIASKPDWNFPLITDDVSQYFAPDFKIYLVGSNKQLEEQAIPTTYSLKGKLSTSKIESYFIFGEGQFEASIYDKGEEYHLEPVSRFSEGVANDLYVMYKPSQIIEKNVTCETKNDETKKGLINTIKADPNNPWKVEITIAGDYQFFKKFRNIGTCIRNIENLNISLNRTHINNGTPVRVLLKTYYVFYQADQKYWAPHSNNLYTSLDQITAAYAQPNSWFSDSDINYFITGDPLVAGAVGLAYFRTMCAYDNPDNNLAFGIGKYYSTSSSATNLIAHETGHMMGLNHDASSRNIMNPSLSRSTNVFTDFSKNELNSYLDQYHACLFQ